MASIISSAFGFFGGVQGGFNGGGSSAAPGAPFPAIYAFGDSLSDAGNDFKLSLDVLPVSPPYSDGRFSNGPVWVQDLAPALGLPSPSPSLSGGTDFAYGGAETGTDPLHTANFIDLPSQLQQFKVEIPHPNSSALYTLSAGSNDVLDAIPAWFSNPQLAISDLQAGVNNIEHFVAGLAGDGARNFLLLNVPDIADTPTETSQGSAHVVVASALSSLFDADLSQTMQVLAAQAHLNIHVVDTFSLIDQAVANPSMFGLTNVTEPVWTGNFTDPNSGALNATTPAAQNQFLFWDSLHPTAQGHSVVAQTAQTDLAGPPLA